MSFMNPEIAYLYGAIHDGYVYFGKSKGSIAVITQKNKKELQEVADILEDFSINCGKLHQYDKKSKCWRFFVKSDSYMKFIKLIKSRHPEKQERLKSFKDQLFERYTR